MEVENSKIVEDLMSDRYKVVANYPHSPYTIGDLVEISETGTSFHCTTTKDYDSFREDLVDQENYFSILRIGDFPHLFKKLEWWEERKESDMPEYVKISEWPHKGEFIYVHVNKKDAWHKFNAGGYFGIKYKTGGGTYIGGGEPHFLPATESEYLTLNKK